MNYQDRPLSAGPGEFLAKTPTDYPGIVVLDVLPGYLEGPAINDVVGELGSVSGLVVDFTQHPAKRQFLPYVDGILAASRVDTRYTGLERSDWDLGSTVWTNYIEPKIAATAEEAVQELARSRSRMPVRGSHF